MSVRRWYEVGDKHKTGAFVHFSDYQKLVEALRKIRSLGAFQGTLAGKIAEVALLSAGEEL